MKVIAIRRYMKQGKNYNFIGGSYESINNLNDYFIRYNIHFKKKDYHIISVEDMTAELLDNIVRKKFFKTEAILRINTINNYNGTYTITVFYSNRFKNEYLVTR